MGDTRDIITEKLHGKGAVKVVGKFLVQGASGCFLNNERGSLIAGVVHPRVLPKEENETDEQMWECEVIIIPIRKFKGRAEFKGMRIDQRLRADCFDGKEWDEKIFDASLDPPDKGKYG